MFQVLQITIYKIHDLPWQPLESQKWIHKNLLFCCTSICGQHQLKKHALMQTAKTHRKMFYNWGCTNYYIWHYLGRIVCKFTPHPLFLNYTIHPLCFLYCLFAIFSSEWGSIRQAPLAVSVSVCRFAENQVTSKTQLKTARGGVGAAIRQDGQTMGAACLAEGRQPWRMEWNWR